jgi:hypothetical protein
MHRREVGHASASGQRIRLGLANAGVDNAAMGIRTRGLEISINASQRAADHAAQDIASKTCRRKTLETPIPPYYFAFRDRN